MQILQGMYLGYSKVKQVDSGLQQELFVALYRAREVIENANHTDEWNDFLCGKDDYLRDLYKVLQLGAQVSMLVMNCSCCNELC